MKSINKSKIAVVLCGGKGLRMGGLTRKSQNHYVVMESL